MKLLPDGPDIPQELLTAQEKGEVLFICGAGVSMTIGLPSFRGLVLAVYEALGENWHLHPAEREIMEPNGRLSGQYDRVLRSLERRLTAAGTAQAGRLRERIRDAVRAGLQPPKDQKADLNAHAALLTPVDQRAIARKHKPDRGWIDAEVKRRVLQRFAVEVHVHRPFRLDRELG